MLEYGYGMNVLGSDRCSNPVQMILEGWLLPAISHFGLLVCLTDFMVALWARFRKTQQASLINDRWNIKCILKRSFLDHYSKIDHAMFMHSHAHAMEIKKTIPPRILILALLGWYADSRLRHTAGPIFVMLL